MPQMVLKSSLRFTCAFCSLFCFVCVATSCMASSKKGYSNTSFGSYDFYFKIAYNRSQHPKP
ncbi:hypothetical protein HAL07_16060 [Helicobacter ailurogastricus]|uniref:Lipoprotein n=1 Tax=Helicobacter ailurogastricus TaxID=1578720 RepID=A0A0K2Y1I8_9HELI|nr:hypothetical protein HAL07_16060 [Helicobacter ailurogastricus]